jgi:hypothetical protein
MPSNKVAAQIRDAVGALAKQREFLKWLKEEKVGDGLVLLNNSFIFRQKLKTIKSDLYLGIPTRTSSHLGVSNVVVVRGIAFNSDFKFVDLKGMKKLEVQEIDQAIGKQLNLLGTIVMVLIGEVQDNVVTRIPIGHSLFSELEVNPAAETPLAIKDKTIQVKSIADEEGIWTELEQAYGARLPSDLAQPLATALDQARKQHYAVLKLPGDTTLSRPLLDSFVDALRQNAIRYKQAWNKCKGLAELDTTEFNDVLRIAYNFASDSVLVIRLLVSICDKAHSSVVHLG